MTDFIALRKQAKIVLQELKLRPTILFHVLLLLNEEKIKPLGPWVPTKGNTLIRQDTQGNTTAEIRPSGTHSAVAQIPGQEQAFTNLNEAITWADSEIIDQGFTLYGDTPPTTFPRERKRP
jgi:hypothetical protein